MASNLFSHGVRPTRQRLAISESLFEKTGSHIDESGLYEELATSATQGCCQTNSNASQKTVIAKSYEAQIWNHSFRAAVRFRL